MLAFMGAVLCKFRDVFELGVGLAAPFCIVSLHKCTYMAKKIPFYMESLALDLLSCLLLF